MSPGQVTTEYKDQQYQIPRLSSILGSKPPDPSAGWLGVHFCHRLHAVHLSWKLTSPRWNQGPTHFL